MKIRKKITFGCILLLVLSILGVSSTYKNIKVADEKGPVIILKEKVKLADEKGPVIILIAKKNV